MFVNPCLGVPMHSHMVSLWGLRSHVMRTFHLMKNNISLSGEHLNINSGARSPRQHSVTISVDNLQESKSDRGKIFTDLTFSPAMMWPAPALTRGKIVITVWAITRESSGTEGHFCRPLIGNWVTVKSSDWPESWTLLTATNWAWNLLERNTTSHFLITSSFSHVVIAKKLISLWQNRETSSSASRQTIITALVKFSKVSLSFSHK